jgi:hypothetical protein
VSRQAACHASWDSSPVAILGTDVGGTFTPLHGGNKYCHNGGMAPATETRLAEVERIIEGLEAAALTTARALEEVSSHWDSVYRAMRRAE